MKNVFNGVYFNIMDNYDIEKIIPLTNISNEK